MSPQWILIAVLIGLVYFFLIKKKPLSYNTDNSKNSKKTTTDEDDMVECKQCGTYVSLKEAFLRDGRYYCSTECLKA